MANELTFAQFGPLFRLHAYLSRKTRFRCLHIIPAEVVGYEIWKSTEGNETGEFNTKLGGAASSVIARELRSRLAIMSAIGGDDSFRIGVAGGQTMYQFAEDMPLIKAGEIQTQIAPLVIGSVPGHRYSAGTIAEMLASKVSVQMGDATGTTYESAASVDRIEEWITGTGEYRVRLTTEIQQTRDTIDRDIERGRPVNNLGRFFDFNCVLVGIGRYNTGDLSTNIAAHVQTFYPDRIPENLLGDICSRLFDNNGQEIDSERQDDFVAISFPILRALVGCDRPIIAIAGGYSKVDAISAIILGNNSEKGKKDGPLINGLITDELTATCLASRL